MEPKKRNQLSILDRPLNPKGRGEVRTGIQYSELATWLICFRVSLNAFSFLFSELIQYSHRKVTSIKDLERRLADVGYSVGQRLLEYLKWREKATVRETRLEKQLLYISSTVWKALFGRDATLTRSKENDKYMIFDDEPLVIRYVSTPKDMRNLNCSAFIAGIIEAVLDASEFSARVTTHFLENQGQRFPRVVFLVDFNKDVLERDAKLG